MIEEVIQIIKCAIAEVEWDYPLDYTVAFETAIDALEKQIPKKLKSTTFTKRCPSCNKQISGIGNLHANYHYCKWCGQKISWKENE